MIGSGMSDGWAAKELTEKGMQTLVLKPGQSIIPERDYMDHLLTNALRESQVTVSNVFPRRSSAEDHRTYKDFLAPVQSADQANAGDLSLRVFALYSGGAIVDWSDDLVQEIVSCFRDADAYYSITFDAPAATADHEYHSLQVKVTGRADLVVSSVKGYYDEP